MAFFTAGAEMIRPGVYHRYENAGGAVEAGARDGVCALVFEANWGAPGTVTEIETKGEAANVFGGFVNENIAARALDGGARKLLCVRVGAGGERGSLLLSGGAGSVRLTARQVGARALSATVRDSLVDENAREMLLYEGAQGKMLIAQVMFAKGGNEAEALAAAVNEGASLPVTAVCVMGGALGDAQQAAFTGGANPVATAADYGAAFELLEAYKWNVLLIDTCASDVQASACAFIEKAVSGGNLGMLALSDAHTLSFEARKARADALDSKNVVYVISGGVGVDGEIVDGAGMAALIGGMIAATPSNLSLTHRKVPGLYGVSNPLTNAQIERCIAGGALVLTQSASGAVWVESGVNTLKTLTAQEDAGWKKIRRVKTRYELIGRIDESIENVIGQVNNDANGRATIMALAQGVINRMICEGKLLGGAVAEDGDRPAAGDSAHFVLSIDDLDSAERVYLVYGFSFGG